MYFLQSDLILRIEKGIKNHGKQKIGRLLFSASSSSATRSSSPLSSFRILRFLRFLSPPPINRTSSLTAHSRSIMAYQQQRGEHKEQMWQKKQSHKKSYRLSPFAEGGSALAEEAVTKRIDTSITAESSRSSNTSAPSMKFGTAGSANHPPAHEQKAIWKQKSYGTTGAKEVEVGKATISQTEVGNMGNGTQIVSEGKSSSDLSKLFKGKILENFAVDNSTYSLAQIRATFYPKFENEKSDQEVRTRIIETVSKGLATLEVSLKHSGSLFMYAGHAGGAYAKNSYGNIYTAVGVFVLGRTFLEAWGARASKKQAEFNEFLERNRMCISMELVTAVLGDHGQRPREDYVTSFFAVYDALCEEGTATPVCKALDEVADVSVPGSKDHIKVQGEILEGLVARIVSHESPNHMEQVLRDYPPPPLEGADQDLGPSLREICAANRSDEKQQIKALLHSVGTSFCPTYLDWFGNEAAELHTRIADRSVLSKFLQAHPSDYSTSKLQEMVRLMSEKRFPAAFKFYYNFQKADSISSNNLPLKMVIHIRVSGTSQNYGHSIEASKETVAEIARNSGCVVKDVSETNGTQNQDGLADEDANLMIKLKFLPYKLRTFLIRNGLTALFEKGPSSYATYYRRAKYITNKYKHKKLSSNLYLSEAEPFLEQYAKRSPENQSLIGSAGDLVRAEDFLAIIEGGRDEEGDLERETPSSPAPSVKDTVPKTEGLIVFFPVRRGSSTPATISVDFGSIPSGSNGLIQAHQDQALIDIDRDPGRFPLSDLLLET
ncbi:hypothetical protein RJ640_012411 [Escallonia rubra]|uniref:Uncharacterized protein n=1 Tax=Escallonia rubra TaxID=112253 RepID=A0AA88REQ6_9ASTE|nr:hypothetical protein RJ640_012411 [Escallonia rubra]